MEASQPAVLGSVASESVPHDTGHGAPSADTGICIWISFIPYVFWLLDVVGRCCGSLTIQGTSMETPANHISVCPSCLSLPPVILLIRLPCDCCNSFAVFSGGMPDWCGGQLVVSWVGPLSSLVALWLQHWNWKNKATYGSSLMFSKQTRWEQHPGFGGHWMKPWQYSVYANFGRDSFGLLHCACWRWTLLAYAVEIANGTLCRKLWLQIEDALFSLEATVQMQYPHSIPLQVSAAHLLRLSRLSRGRRAKCLRRRMAAVWQDEKFSTQESFLKYCMLSKRSPTPSTSRFEEQQICFLFLFLFLLVVCWQMACQLALPLLECDSSMCCYSHNLSLAEELCLAWHKFSLEQLRIDFAFDFGIITEFNCLTISIREWEDPSQYDMWGGNLAQYCPL